MPITMTGPLTEDQQAMVEVRLAEMARVRLRLEVGKYYRTAEGKVHGPMKVTKSHPDRFTDEQGNWYGDDGHYWQQRPDCPFRLVAEVTKPESRP